MMIKGFLASVAVSLLVLPTWADSLYDADKFDAYAADQRANGVGDILTILVFENSQAFSNADSEGDRSLSAGFNLNSTNDSDFGDLDLDFNEQGSRETQRAGRLRAQISAVVEEVDANGRMRLAGIQEIVVNGDKQVITIKGWVRPVDIAANNTVLSTRLADAFIEYKGDGLDSLNGRGGIIRRVGEIVMWVPKKALDITAWLLGVL